MATQRLAGIQKGGAQTNPLKSLSLVKEAALLIVHLWAETAPEGGSAEKINEHFSPLNGAAGSNGRVSVCLFVIYNLQLSLQVIIPGN